MTHMQGADDHLVAAERIASTMQRIGISSVVIGAIALAAHRYIRFTEDIDLGVDAQLAQLRDLAAALTLEGFETTLHEPDLQDPLGGVLDVTTPSGLVQVVNFGDRFPAVIRDALAANPAPIRPGSPLKMVPLAQLIALKLYAGGSRSQADIVELLRRNPDADLTAIHAVCRKYRLKGFDTVLAELES